MKPVRKSKGVGANLFQLFFIVFEIDQKAP